MGFSAMFTFQLDNTKRETLPAPHCRNGSCRYVWAVTESASMYAGGRAGFFGQKGLFNLTPDCIVDGDFLLPNEIDSWNFRALLAFFFLSFHGGKMLKNCQKAMYSFDRSRTYIPAMFSMITEQGDFTIKATFLYFFHVSSFLHIPYFLL